MLSAILEFVAPDSVPTLVMFWVAMAMGPDIVPPAKGKYEDKAVPLEAMIFPVVPEKTATTWSAAVPEHETMLSAVRLFVAPDSVPTPVMLWADIDTSPVNVAPAKGA